MLELYPAPRGRTTELALLDLDYWQKCTHVDRLEIVRLFVATVRNDRFRDSGLTVAKEGFEFDPSDRI